MNNATYTMKMPTNYVEMDSSEMEYDGGWSWNKFFAVTAIVGAVVAGIGAAILTGGAAAFIIGGGALYAGTAATTAMAVGATILGVGSTVSMVSGGGFLLTSD